MYTHMEIYIVISNIKICIIYMYIHINKYTSLLDILNPPQTQYVKKFHNLF